MRGAGVGADGVGVLLIRGENVVMLGEIVRALLLLAGLSLHPLTLQDLIAEDEIPLREIPLEEIKAKIAADEVSPRLLSLLAHELTRGAEEERAGKRCQGQGHGVPRLCVGPPRGRRILELSACLSLSAVSWRGRERGMHGAPQITSSPATQPARRTDEA